MKNHVSHTPSWEDSLSSHEVQMGEVGIYTDNEQWQPSEI